MGYLRHYTDVAIERFGQLLEENQRAIDRTRSRLRRLEEARRLAEIELGRARLEKEFFDGV